MPCARARRVWRNRYMGDIAGGRAHLDRAIALYDPAEHRPLAAIWARHTGGISSRRSWALWLLGYPEAALRDADDMLRGCARDRPSRHADVRAERQETEHRLVPPIASTSRSLLFQPSRRPGLLPQRFRARARNGPRMNVDQQQASGIALLAIEPASRSWRRREAVSPSMIVAATKSRWPRNAHASMPMHQCWGATSRSRRRRDDLRPTAGGLT